VVAFHQDVVDLRCFFEDIAGWGWPSAPPRRLLFYADIPRTPDALPRALTPDVDRALRAAVANLDDALVRTGLLLLRATGMRIGELLDLELDCLLDFAGHATWLRVPVGKLNSERMVPLDPDIVQMIDAWIAQRGRQRALPHPRGGRLTEFLFLEHGCRPTSFRLRKGLLDAVTAAELRGRDGKLLHVTPHQLRHTFGTSLKVRGIASDASLGVVGDWDPLRDFGFGGAGAGVVRRDAGRVAVAAAGPAVGRVDHRCAGTHAPAVRRVHRWLAVVLDGGTVGVVDRDRRVGAFRRSAAIRARSRCSWSMCATTGMAGSSSVSSASAPGRRRSVTSGTPPGRCASTRAVRPGGR
jgi:hypothetical protein